MPVVVKVLPQDEFDAWLEAEKAARQAAGAMPVRTAAAAMDDQAATLRVANAE
jgi:heme/copper-type cytochrome/quinol oxidase subunit 2